MLWHHAITHALFYMFLIGIVCLNKLKKILDTANESPDTIMVIQKYIGEVVDHIASF